MRRFHFPLDSALRLRRQLEEQAQVELAESRRRLMQEQAAVDEIERQLQLHERLRVQMQQSLISPLTLSAADPYREELAQARHGSQAAVREAHEAVERCLQGLHRRRVDREALERLRERRRSEHRQEVLQEEQRSLDETAVIRWRKDL